MIAEVTDALLDAAIASAKMVDAGREIWRHGSVGRVDREPDRGMVRATVQGTARLPYRVELRFGPRAGLATTCSCPVGIGCKHAAAVLFALRATQDDPDGAGSGVAGGSRRPPVAPAEPPPLPPGLAQWATGMKPLLERHLSAGRPASRAVLYVVRVQERDGKRRPTKKQPLASLAVPGHALRLTVEPVDVELDGNGAAVGRGTRVHPHEVYAERPGPAAMDDGDRLIVRRLQRYGGDIDHENCLTGAGGADLFERILATGRARWDTARGPVLHRAAPVPARLAWGHDDLGRARLSVEGVAADGVVVLAAPPFLIDTAGGAVAPLDPGVPPAMAEQLLRLPPVEPDAVAALAGRWRELVPDHIPAPVAPQVRELGAVAPVPVVALCIDRVTIRPWHGRRYRQAGRTQMPCALARLTFDYAGTIVGAGTPERVLLVRRGDDLVRFTRDREAESGAAARLLATGLTPLYGFDDIEPDARQAWDHAPDMPAAAEDFTGFAAYDADLLRAEGWRVEIAADFPLRVTPLAADALSAAVVPSGIDWFDLELGATVEGVRVDLVPALRRMLATFGAGELAAWGEDLAAAGDMLPVALGDGRVVTVDAAAILPMLRALVTLAADDPATGGGGSGRAGFSRLDLGLLGELEAATPRLAWTGAEPLRRLARELTRAGPGADLAPAPLPPGFAATLRPYQQAGFDWLEALARAGFGGLLADDMGLGKTVQTLAHIAAQKAAGALAGPVLIVAPTSVLPNWQAEAARFAPGLSVRLHHGPARHDPAGPLAGHDVVLTSYPLLARDAARLAAETFGLVVLDEAHVLKNPRTAGHAAVRGLKPGRRIALTGTPVENRLTDAWALFALVVPGLLGEQRDFQRRYRLPIEKHGDAAAARRLARRLGPFLLRRTKDAVATDLPAKSVVPVTVVPGAAQMALHESQRILMQQRVRDEIARVGLMRAQIVVLTALTRLRQICCDPRLLPDAARGTRPPPSAKLERLLELLDELVAEGRRIVLFSQFTTMLDLIKPELDRHGLAWVELTGASRDRATPVARFQAGEVPLILVSLKAGGTGLNLTAADSVILYDPWWNPAVEAQAIDRAHRIGQRRPVFVYRLIAGGTIEEKILALQVRKAALADALWSEDTTASAQLTEEDIDFLLG